MRTEGKIHRAPEVGGVAVGLDRGADAILGDDDVACDVRHGVEYTEARRVAPSAAVAPVRGLLRDFVAHVLPAAQRGRQARARALCALPGDLGAHKAVACGLLGPIEGCAWTDDVSRRPLDMRAHGTGGRVHEKNTASNGGHGPSFLSRCVFPNDLCRNGYAVMR